MEEGNEKEYKKMRVERRNTRHNLDKERGKNG